MHACRREKPRLLLVEDHKHMREMLSQLFSLSGWDVAACRDLNEAYQSLATHYGTYDAAVVDMMLPDGTGHDFIRDLRVVQPHVRVVVCTAGRSEKAVRLAVEAGADAVTYKPVSWPESLYTVVLGDSPGEAHKPGEGEPWSIPSPRPLLFRFPSTIKPQVNP
jgi:two-component system chemotaxis response regulator CheY